MGNWQRAPPEEQRLVAEAHRKAEVLYEGRHPHRSCGIAMAETFGPCGAGGFSDFPAHHASGRIVWEVTNSPRRQGHP